ncbi:MAG: hypothetical protein IPG47_09540 [Thermoflexaceae bacterium]|nr:hypothetical protein [Thermoflexaceae bacterium]
MAPVLAFWAAAMVVGACALPIAFVLFRRFPDAGAGLAFPLGLVLSGYAYFVLRIGSVLPQGRGGAVLAVVALVVAAAAAAGQDRRFRETARRFAPGALAAAGLFTLCFFAYVSYRSYVPDIAGTEQPMDFMYLNAAIESPTYPPIDPWLAGERASYYYFGYVQSGLLTQVAGVAPEEGYNLTLAYTFAAAATSIACVAFAVARWALGVRLRRWAFVAAGVSVGFLLLAGSLSAVFELAAAHGNYNRGLYEAFGVEWLIPCPEPTGNVNPADRVNCFTGPTEPRTTSWYPTEFWFWWRGSRVIPNTITEFPFFSFLLGDMHPHVMSLPLVILSLGLAASLWRGRSLLAARTHLRRPGWTLAFGIILGALAFQNAWDLLTFAAVVGAAVFLRNLRRAPFMQAAPATLGYLWPLMVLAVALYAPWYRDFSSQASGFYAYVGEGTRPAHAFLQFGPLLLASLMACTWAFRRAPLAETRNALLLALWAPLVPLLGWMLLASARGDFSTAIEQRGAGGWVTLTTYAVAVWLLTGAFGVLVRGHSRAAVAPALGAVGALLIYGAELFLIRDVFFGGQPRLNTVFKLTYQAWMLLSLAGGVALAMAFAQARARLSRAAWLGAPVAVLAVLTLVYPVTATANRVGASTAPTTIDGLAYVARNNPGEYALVQWLRTHTAPGDVVIEGSGRTWGRGQDARPVVTNAGVDYGESGRISARTGRATPIGWYFHEVQWRGQTEDTTRELTYRQDLVDGIYLATDTRTIIPSMREAGAEYLVVGTIENSRYAGLMPRFDEVLDPVFRMENATVYRIPVLEQVRTE